MPSSTSFEPTRDPTRVGVSALGQRCGPLLALLWLLIGTAALAEDRDAPAPPPETAPETALAPAPGEALESGVWQLDAYSIGSTLRPTAAGAGNGYALFEGGRFRINAGCSTLTGSYWLQGSRLMFSPYVESLLNQCPDTLLAQEQAVVQLLPRVEQLAVAGDRLTLADLDGAPLLTLLRPDKVPLQGRLWQLKAYRNGADVIVQALPEPVFTLTFDSAASLSGQACDSFRAVYTRDERFLRLVGPIAASRLGCPDSAAATVQDDDFIAALGRVRSYRVDERALLLRDEHGRMLASFAALDSLAGDSSTAPADRLPAAPTPRLLPLR